MCIRDSTERVSEPSRSVGKRLSRPMSEIGRSPITRPTSDPAGRVKTKTQTVAVIQADGTTTTETTETTTREDSRTISGMFGVPLGERYKVWGGLIESRFGGQIEWKPTPRWEVALQAFDFDRPNDESPHIRLLGSWQPKPHILLIGGYDDPLVSARDSFFLGLGIRWRDDDLKYLLGSVPKF